MSLKNKEPNLRLVELIFVYQHFLQFCFPVIFLHVLVKDIYLLWVFAVTPVQIIAAIGLDILLSSVSVLVVHRELA